MKPLVSPLRLRRRLRAAGRLPALLLAVLLAACSSVRPWINTPLGTEPPPDATTVADRDPGTLVAVTLSGGGARAAAFGYGVLLELRATHWVDRGTNLLDAVDVISGVSGGSIIAAYYAAFGPEGLDRFESDFLRQRFQNGLLSQLANPDNLYDLTSPWFGRSQLLERRLDQLYKGMTFGDIERRPRHPQLVVTATDLTLGTGFEFTVDQFELICSDLYGVPLSFAVTASSAVPLLLSPLTLKNYNDQCPARASLPSPARTRSDDYRARLLESSQGSYLDANARPFIHLVDGGLSDNLGVRNLLDRALAGGSLRSSFREVGIPKGSIHKLVLITVNSARSPAKRIDDSGKVPDTFEVIDALVFGAGEHATIETQEYLADITRKWQQDVRRGAVDGSDAFAPDAEIYVVPVNLRDAPDAEQRARLLQVPTAFSIGNAEVTNLIAAGRGVLRQSPQFRTLLKSLGARPAADEASGPQ